MEGPRDGQSGPVLVNAVHLVLAAFIAWGRFGPWSFGG